MRLVSTHESLKAPWFQPLSLKAAWFQPLSLKARLVSTLAPMK
jgi:hypothetical protein